MNMGRLHWITFYFLLLALAGESSWSNSDCLRRNLDLNAKFIQTNKFIIDRNFEEYVADLGQGFVDDLASFPEDSQWFDSGTGLGRVFFGANRQSVEIRTRNFTGYGHTRPPDAVKAVPGRNYRYIEGGYLEDYPVQKIGPVDLITDNVGPFSYTLAPHIILKKYLEMLKVGRSAYICLKAEGHLVIDGVDSGLEHWLSSVSGADIKFIHTSAISTVIKITKTSDTFHIPDLIFDEIVATRPPARRFHR